MNNIFDARRNHSLQMAEKNRDAGMEDMATFWKGKADEAEALQELFNDDFVSHLLEEIEDYGKLGPRSIVIINDDNYIPVTVISRIIKQNANGERYKWGCKKKEGTSL